MQICHTPFPISWGPFENVKLLYFLLKMQIWNGCNALNIAGNAIKDINVNLTFLSSGSKVVEQTPQIWHLVEIFEILLLHVLSNECIQICYKTFFPISWGPFENVQLLYFLLKMQVWNGCNVLNIIGNPIKDINVNLTFLSSGSKAVEWTPTTQIWHLVLHCSALWVWLLWDVISVCSFTEFAEASIFGVI